MLTSTLYCYAQPKDTLRVFSDPKETTHSVKINGSLVDYKAVTGYLNLLDEKGNQIANLFYTSYEKIDEANKKERPITFCFNGGPGSSSIWLHIGALGPRRILMDDIGNATAPPYEMIDNEYSWLDLTDLVFVDPVGTGFSRPKKDHKESNFYGFNNDIKSVGEFIRLYLNRNKRWASPKYIVGESYGTTRAVGLSDYLMEKHGMYLNGIILISCAIDFQTLREYEGNDMPYICNLPAYAASAFYHKKLGKELSVDLDATLKEVEKFAIEEYSVALHKGDLLNELERNQIAMKLSSYTGLDVKYILDNNLRVPSYRFRKKLLTDSLKCIGRYDSRITCFDSDPTNSYSRTDPSYMGIKGAFGTCINSYVRTELQYENDLPYKIIGSVRPWDYANGKYLDVRPKLKQSLMHNPKMKVWVASGYYDLATSYFGTNYTLNHLNLPIEIKGNISQTYYHAGHMMYLLKSEIQKMKKDAVTFFVH